MWKPTYFFTGNAPRPDSNFHEILIDMCIFDLLKYFEKKSLWATVTLTLFGMGVRVNPPPPP